MRPARLAAMTTATLLGGVGAAWGVSLAGQPRPATYDLRGRNVVITGGNSGIGRETAVALARGGAHVVITARDSARGQEAVDDIRARSGNDSVDLVHLDLSSLASVRACAADLRSRLAAIDVLVNNAGAVQATRTETEDGFETTIGANHLGPFLLTDLLLPLLRAAAPSRIVVVSSLAHRQASLDLDDLMYERRPYVPMDAYGASKLANLLFARQLARRLDGSGVTVNALHPGTVGSGFGADGDAGPVMGRLLDLVRPLLLDAERGASTSVFAAADASLDGVTGAYLSRRRVVRPSAQARDDALAAALWERSAELVSITSDR